MLFVFGIAGCAAKGDAASLSCGFAALSTPLAVQDAFGRGQAMTGPPWNPHDSINVRVVAGPLFAGSVVEEKSGWQVRISQKLPVGAHTGYGVLVADTKGNNRGILLFDGSVIPGAVLIGKVNVADSSFPLIGVRMASKSIDDPACPIFRANE